MSVWGDIAGLLGFDSSSGTAQAEASLGGSSFAGLATVGAALDAFFAELSSIAMWRSLGWLGLGVLMMAAGAWLWLRGG